MKKLPIDYKLRQYRIASDRAIRKLRDPDDNTSTKKTSPIFTSCRVTAPVNLNLHIKRDRKKLITFLNDLKKKSLKFKNIKIDFRNTENIVSCGMILFLAEIDRIVKILGNSCNITCNYPKNNKVEKVLQQIGFLNLLRVKSRQTITEKDSTVYYWEYLTGESNDLTSAETMLSSITSRSPKSDKKLFKVLSEAITNTLHHAYTSFRKDSIQHYDKERKRTWWTFALVNENRITLTLCDLGIGIPVSLEQKWFESIKDILALSTKKNNKIDAKMIERAIDLGRTRTSQKNRGKGLHDMVKSMKEINGHILIYSNYGSYSLNYKNNDTKTKHTNFDESISGTIIEWSIPLEEI